MSDLSFQGKFVLDQITGVYAEMGSSLKLEQYHDVMGLRGTPAEHELMISELRILGFRVNLVRVFTDNVETSGYFVRFSGYPEWFLQKLPRPVVVAKEDLREVLRRLYAALGVASPEGEDPVFAPWAGSNPEEKALFERVFSALK